MSRNAILTAGLRTPFTRAFKGTYAGVRPDDLMVELLTAHRQRWPHLWTHGWEDLFLGCAYPEGEQGYNMARTVAMGCGLDMPGAVVNRLCASSIEAVAMAATRIRSGWGRAYLAGGVESMSRIPRRGANFSESQRIRSVCPDAYISNGDTAENVARQFPHHNRDSQEAFAAASHTLADQAWQDGHYGGQVHPWQAERDEFIRVPVDREKMASLAPVFAEDGVVTAATSSPLTDGAASAAVMDRDLADSLGVTGGVEILDAVTAHVAPGVMGMGPVPATRTLLQRNSLAVAEIAAWEINEAFAIQVLASADELEIPLDRVNRWGGAIALGHPLGASGLRLLMTLHDRLLAGHQVGDYGVATLCVGGGQGMSMLVRRF